MPVTANHRWTLIALLFVGCGESADPLAEADERYTQIMVDLAAADRDSTRNIRNREARKRKVAAESARASFFDSKRIQAIIRDASESDNPAVQAKLTAYERHRLIAGSWTNEERKEESQLLTRLDDLNGVEAT